MGTQTLEQLRVELTPRTIGMVIRLARQNQDLSQVRLAEMAGLVQPTISELEKGRAQNSENLDKVARALGLKLSRLIEAAEQIESAKGRGTKGFFATVNALTEALDPIEIGELFREATGQ